MKEVSICSQLGLIVDSVALVGNALNLDGLDRVSQLSVLLLAVNHRYLVSSAAKLASPSHLGSDYNGEMARVG